MKDTSLALHFVSSGTKESLSAQKDLVERYGHVAAEDADIIVALGGDGTMLQALRDFMNTGKPIYGMNRGSVGFLMNEFVIENLPERILAAQMETIRPLVMVAETEDAPPVEALAINEVSLFRQSYQAARIRITIDGKVRLQELVCDGVMVATPAGSTAYNLSAQGPILPLEAPLLALTPVSPFRPRRWGGALLPKHVTVRMDLLETEKRPVNAVADNNEVKSVTSVTVREAPNNQVTILFDKNHSWDERILTEQFRH
ncbi:NAD kinase [Brucella neotomae]|uniref:NAD kinase n=1 Tax=Brucella neotomae 5K33 TaxID=520456 RepID=A0A7U8KB90_BRUNE|nr:NAD kinase [Brucella neotomae]EEY04514.1 inorganic polyphosphate/ATP-NAD kinase [Brucella neotomae 5K33]KEY00803.1 inorganic polyphosphate kinase [Brucella neotomae 5K33]KFJ58805.1 ATP-NAD kinase family protein [Brucella neotomae 5K33]SPU66935.1 inorganic polyphosphate/ATP-NAD kinase [Brucella neotomae]SPU70870.1 inorganic polyphosphate/ATP-NAD kinase [Brucella neotomae]